MHANLLESLTQVSFTFINGCSFPGANNSQFLRYSYCIYVCAYRRICVFHTDFKAIVFHFCFLHGFNNSNFICSMVLAASLLVDIGIDRYHILQRVGRLVTIGTDRYRILQRVGGHWSPLVQIATDVGSRWEKSEFRL